MSGEPELWKVGNEGIEVVNNCTTSSIHVHLVKRVDELWGKNYVILDHALRETFRKDIPAGSVGYMRLPESVVLESKLWEKTKNGMSLYVRVNNPTETNSTREYLHNLKSGDNQFLVDDNRFKALKVTTMFYWNEEKQRFETRKRVL